jgi:hypothetical protein
MRRLPAIVAVTALCAGSVGCHSHYIQATITNGSGAPLNVIQVDYPSASFGVQSLAPGEVFRYRFKLLGSGPIKLTFVDAKNRDHAVTGPLLNEGQEGPLDITVTQDRAEFHGKLKP